MEDDLAQEAIKQALEGNWEIAIKLNKQILSEDEDNIDALNRLARAYSEVGRLDLAKATAKKVLALDPFNTIAAKSLEKWKSAKSGEVYKSDPIKPQLFLEEPGKTKVISLIHLGDNSVIAKLDAGDEVKLNAHGHKISVCTKESRYIGRLPDDISARIKTLLKKGYEYAIWIKSAGKKEVKVFIREVKRPNNYFNVPSFTSEKIDYISFTPPELIHKKDEALVLTDDTESSDEVLPVVESEEE